MQLFSIVTKDENDEFISIDFTSAITVPSYKVNEFDVSDDWKDGNGVKHKNIVRTRVEGKFTFKFQSVEDFNNFFTVLNENKIATGDYSGSVLANVYVQNKNVVRTTYVFVDADPEDTLPLIGNADYDGFEVTIEEV